MKNNELTCKSSGTEIGRLMFVSRGYVPLPWFLMCLVWADFELSSILVGFIFIAVGEILRFYSAGYLGIHLRTTRQADAEELIISGPYRMMRNPIYVGNMSIYLGFCVLSNVFFPLAPVVILLFFLIIYWFIASYEERVLYAKFGDMYSGYLKSIPQFLPLIWRPYPSTGHTFSFEHAWASERWTFLTVFIAMSSLFLRMFYIHSN